MLVYMTAHWEWLKAEVGLDNKRSFWFDTLLVEYQIINHELPPTILNDVLEMQFVLRPWLANNSSSIVGVLDQHVAFTRRASNCSPVKLTNVPVVVLGAI